MKKLLYVFVAALAFAACNDDDSPTTDPQIETVTLSTGADYANDIYYSLTDGVIATPSRTEWDIAFYTNPMSSSIITNDGKGILLYVWPNGNKDAWANVDTSAMSRWTPLYNTYSDTTWENGAFDKGALGHPDYGWGEYDTNTHSVYGDSIHVIKYADGTVKKLFIDRREATNNTFYITFANIDGSEETSAEIDASTFTGKNFVYFSILNNQVIDHEPEAGSWDFVFTKYWDSSIPYSVTGFLTNGKTMVAELADTDTASNKYIDAEYSKVLNTIGSDWKAFSMETFTYVTTDNLLYYVKTTDNKYFKLVFTSFDYQTGDFTFVKTTY
jgi:hypothetical protein